MVEMVKRSRVETIRKKKKFKHDTVQKNHLKFVLKYCKSKKL